MQSDSRLLATLERIGRWTEDAMLVVLLAAMVLLASAQIVMRNVFDTGLVWSDELLRLGVLWITLIGAIAASRDNHQISIDILSRFLPPRVRRASAVAIALFTCAVCAVIAWYSLAFVREAAKYGDTLLGDLPAWWFQVILPVGFGLISYRYLVHAISGIVALVRGGDPP